MRVVRTLAGLIAAALASSAACAADLRVAPSTVEAPPGAQTATIAVINGDPKPLAIQVRVMRWTQQGGQETLAPTQDVVASPPFATLQPSQRYLVRLVRTTKSALPAGEESYRVLIDELPGQNKVPSGTIDLVLRHSVPVFFSASSDRMAKVSWTIVRDGQGAWLSGQNAGERRLRLADVTLDENGSVFYKRPGLVGYVLPGAEMRWALGSKVPAGGVHMSAMADTGPIDVTVSAQTGR